MKSRAPLSIFDGGVLVKSSNSVLETGWELSLEGCVCVVHLLDGCTSDGEGLRDIEEVRLRLLVASKAA